MKKISILLAAFVFLCPLITWGQSTIASSGGAAVQITGQLNAGLIVSLANSGAGCPNNNIPLVGVPISCQLALQGAGGQPPYNFGTITGGLPSGLSMTTGVNGGLISGTATSTSATTASFPVTDSSTPPQSVTVTLNYTPLAVFSGSVSITCPPQSVLASGTLTCHSIGLFGSATNNTGNVSAGLDSLATFSCPATCGSSGASFTGNVLTAGTAGTANVEATFQSVTSSLLPITVTTSGSPVVIQYPTAAGGLPNGQQFQAYPDSQVVGQAGIGQCIQVQASGGTPPYTYTISSGSLPPGLTLGSSTGMICGNGTTAASGSSLTIMVQDSASHSSTVVISGGITVVPLTSTTAPAFGSNPITPNAQTQATTTGAYSADSTTSTLVNALAALVMTGTGITNTSHNSASLQVPPISTQTGWALGGIAISWANAACSGTTMTITSANETFNSVATQTGQTGVPPPYGNCVQSFLATNVTGNAADTPACNFSPSNGAACYVFAISGVPTSSLLDQSPANTSSILSTPTATACTPASITTGQANTVAIGFCAPNSANGFSPPNGYLSQGNSYVNVYTQVLNSAQTIQPADSFTGGASNEVGGIFSIKANTPAAGGVLWFSGTPSCATIAANGLITALAQTTTCTTVITDCIGGTGGASCTGGVSNSSTLTVQVSNVDTSILIVPNPTASATLLSGGGFTCAFSGPAPSNTPCQFQAIGNVTSQQYQAAWGSSNTNVATVGLSSGVATPLTVGSAVVQATVSGFSTAATTTLSVVSQAAGNNIPATDCSLAALNTAWGKMIAGANVILLPSCAAGGTGVYSGQFSQTAPSNVTSVTIQGNTAVNCSGTPGTSTYACTSTDNTVLTDSYNSTGTMWNLNIGSAAIRITGITFQGGSGVTSGKSNGFIKISGSTQSLRVDHNHFDALTYSGTGGANGGGATLVGYMAGVFDHNLLELSYTNNGFRYYPESFGDVGWSQPSTPGGSVNTIFLENNYMKEGGFINDCDQGGRMVIRYNYLAGTPGAPNNSGGMQTHTISQGVGRFMGCRSMEQYHNYSLNPTPSILAFSPRDVGSGSLNVVWDNTISTGWSADNVFQNAGRAKNGNNCGGSGCPAPPNGFGYCGTGSTGSSSPWDGNSNSSGYPCMNALGRGQQDLLNNGQFPNVLDSVTGTITWPHSLLEPVYSWGETVPSGNLYTITNWNGEAPVANRDFYIECRASNPSCSGTFNGTAGVGIGTLPPTNPSAYSGAPNCTAGAGGTYGISPTGSYGVGFWDSAANSGQGELYVCTATNTWTPVYQPYVYPHPLDH